MKSNGHQNIMACECKVPGAHGLFWSRASGELSVRV
jgi:hypothetical protein